MFIKKVAACLTGLMVLALALPVLAGAQTSEKPADAATPAAQEAEEETKPPKQPGTPEPPAGTPEAEAAEEATAEPTPEDTPEAKAAKKPAKSGALSLYLAGRDVTNGAVALNWADEAAGAPTARVRATGPDGQNASPVFQSSDESVAKIDASGLITAEGFGIATISAALDARTASFEISVSREATRLVIIGEDTVSPGRSIKLRAFDQDGNRVSAVWRSSSDKLASVSPDGVLTASRAATGKRVEITATAGEGTPASAAVTILIE